MMKPLLTTALKFTVVSFALMVCLLANGQNSNLVVDKIIAKVDNYIVLKSDLEKSYLEYLSRGEFNQGNAKCGILEQLIVNKMLVAKAEIDSVLVDDADVAESLRRRMDYMLQQVGSEEEIEKFYGKRLDQIESELFDEVKEQMTIQKMEGEVTTKLKVTPSEVRKFFERIPRDSLPYFSTEVSVAQIVMDPKPGEKQVNDVKARLSSIRDRILAGESFSDLAKLYSEDPGSGPNGGELPFFRRGELAPEYEATALTLEDGVISEPVVSEFGVHIIELMEKRGNTFKSRHILISPRPSFEDVKRAEMELDSIRTLILNDSITFREAAKEWSDDDFTSGNGGHFTDGNGSVKVAVESLDPNIFFTIDTMKVGSITRPLKFSKPDGKQSFRILNYVSKTPPHQANLGQDYQKISDATMNQKRAIEMNKWFERARKDVFIEVDGEYDYCDILNKVN